MSRVKPEAKSFYFSKRAAADHAAVSAKTIQRWIKAGILPVVRVGRLVRVRRLDLDRMMEAHLCLLHEE